MRVERLRGDRPLASHHVDELVDGGLDGRRPIRPPNAWVAPMHRTAIGHVPPIEYEQAHCRQIISFDHTIAGQLALH